MIGVRDEKLLREFGKHLIVLRNSRGMSQEKLAFIADVSLSQVSRIERGLINPTLSTLSALAKGLKVPLKKLVDF